MPRFVVLRHETPPGCERPSHWDLMFEYGESLRTWSVVQLPTSERVVKAQRLADHRAEYLHYVGTLSGDRGTVSRWDAGEYEVTRELPDHWTVHVRGTQWTGQLTLQRDDEQRGSWTAHFVAD